MNTAPQVFLYKRGSISSADKAALKSVGYIPIACQDPNDVTLLMPSGAKLKGDAVLQAALRSITGASSLPERQKFGEAIIQMLLK